MNDLICCILLSCFVIGIFMTWEKRGYIFRRLRQELVPYTFKYMTNSPAVKEMMHHPLITDVIADMGKSFIQGAETPISQAMRVGNSIIIPYKYNKNTYNIIFPHRPPKQISKATALIDGVTEDVTDKIRSYAGATGNFHGITIKVKEVIRNCTSLTIEYKDVVIAYESDHDIQPV